MLYLCVQSTIQNTKNKLDFPHFPQLLEILTQEVQEFDRLEKNVTTEFGDLNKSSRINVAVGLKKDLRVQLLMHQ